MSVNYSKEAEIEIESTNRDFLQFEKSGSEVFKVDINGSVYSTPLKVETAYPDNFLPLYVDTDTGKIFADSITYYDDLRFPASIARLSETTGRLTHNYFNGTAVFAANARYPEEPLSMLAQMPHRWIEQTAISPHIHWIQQGSSVPNWLLAYKIYDNGQATTISTNYSAYTFAKVENTVFTYSSGTIVQISSFPDIDMTGYGLSDMIHFVLFRDSANVSTLFTGADPSLIGEHLLEFDIHYQSNDLGTLNEFSD